MHTDRLHTKTSIKHHNHYWPSAGWAALSLLPAQLPLPQWILNVCSSLCSWETDSDFDTELFRTDVSHICFAKSESARLKLLRESDSGSTCPCGGLRIYLTPLTSGGFLVYVTSQQLPLAQPLLAALDHSFFPTHSLIIRGLTMSLSPSLNLPAIYLQTCGILLISQRFKTRPLTSVPTTQTRQPWRLLSFSSSCLNWGSV